MKTVIAVLTLGVMSFPAIADRFGDIEDVKDMSTLLLSISAEASPDELVRKLESNDQRFAETELGIAVMQSVSGEMRIAFHNKFPELKGESFHGMLDLRGQDLLSMFTRSADEGGSKFSVYYPHDTTGVEFEYQCYAHWLDSQQSLVTVCH